MDPKTVNWKKWTWGKGWGTLHWRGYTFKVFKAGSKWMAYETDENETVWFPVDGAYYKTQTKACMVIERFLSKQPGIAKTEDGRVGTFDYLLYGKPTSQLWDDLKEVPQGYRHGARFAGGTLDGAMPSYD
jgi:hypothetical protein